MKDMTEQQAWAEATKRWGTAATVEYSAPRSERRGRLARYTCRVSNGAGGGYAIEGQGYTWREAFDDACLRLTSSNGESR
jgi:hypothetical protein